MVAAAVEVRGLREFRRELRAIDKTAGTKWTRELGRAHKSIGILVAGQAQGIASGMGGQQSHFASEISGRGTVTGAFVGLRGGRGSTAFWGAKKRTGWNARNVDSAQQHPTWVGASWRAGVAGEGPYAINDAVAQQMPQIMAQYDQAVGRVVSGAFPSRGA